MKSIKRLDTKKIQSELEDWIYKMNSGGVLEGKYYLSFLGYEEGFDKLSEKELDELEERYSGNEEFYSKQMAHQPRASINIKMEYLKKETGSTVYDGPVPKIECFLTPGKVDKKIFKEFVELGWKIHGYPFKYIFCQEDIYDKESKIANLFSETISLLGQYNWELKLVY
jgi:hypothetical protein